MIEFIIPKEILTNRNGPIGYKSCSWSYYPKVRHEYPLSNTGRDKGEAKAIPVLKYVARHEDISIV